MTNQVKDQVSALLDDELEARECALLLARFSKDEELKATWERYSLIGDCIRGNLPAHLSADMAKRIASEIEKNPVAAKGLPAARSALWRPVAGLAVAASVAAVALISLGNLDRNVPGVLPETGAPLAASADEESYTVPVINMREQASASLRERLNLYQVSHSEVAGPMQRRSLISQMASDDAFEDLEAVPQAESERE